MTHIALYRRKYSVLPAPALLTLESQQAATGLAVTFWVSHPRFFQPSIHLVQDVGYHAHVIHLVQDVGYHAHVIRYQGRIKAVHGTALGSEP